MCTCFFFARHVPQQHPLEIFHALPSPTRMKSSQRRNKCDTGANRRLDVSLPTLGTEQTQTQREVHPAVTYTH